MREHGRRCDPDQKILEDGNHKTEVVTVDVLSSRMFTIHGTVVTLRGYFYMHILSPSHSDRPEESQRVNLGVLLNIWD